MTPTYLFYDIETTGLNSCFDQVLQFAAIRTDLNLNEIERYEIMIKLNCDITPSPEAMKTHGIPMEAIATGQNEYEAIQTIHQLLNTPGTISLGYNTLGFDDEFLRFSFHRNLLSPYTHQFANRCSRMDIYPMTLLYYLFKPNVTEWPEVDGHISLKLEYLNEANQFIDGKAHDAMVDVEVTLELAKRFYNESEMWGFISGYFNKQTDIERCSKLSSGIIVDGKLGYRNNFVAPVLHLGQHHVYKNQSLWLRLDDDALTNINIDKPEESTYVIRKKAGESPIILPEQKRFLEKIDLERLSLAQQNRHYLQENPNIFDAICNYHLNYTYLNVENVDIDAALYQLPFPTSEEQALFQRFHRANVDQKQSLIDAFQNPLRQEQAVRILGRHYPEILDKNHKEQFNRYMEKIELGKVIDYKNNVKDKVPQLI